MKFKRILVIAVLCWTADAQQPGTEGRPFQFQSFGGNEPSPPQSFQRINFFGPLQSGAQTNRNPFFASPPQGPQDPRAGQREFAPTLSASIQQTPANTGIFRAGDSSPKPLFQFQFGTNTEQLRQQQQRPFRPSVADQPDAPVRPVAQLPALPVPIGLRPRTPRPEPAVPIRAPPSSDSQESPSSFTSAERRDPGAFQRLRPTPKEENKATQLQKQTLTDQRDDRQLRNRLRRPDGSESAEVQQTTRRLRPESSAEVVATTQASVLGRGRVRVTLSSAEAEIFTTTRPRGVFVRGRTTVQPTTSTEVEASTEEATTRRPAFVTRRRPQTNSAESSSEKPRVFHSNASVFRLKNNGNFRLSRPEAESSSEVPTTSSERSVESTTPPASVNAVDGPSSERPDDETSPGEEEDDDAIVEEEDDEEYEDDNESTPEVESSSTPSTTSSTATPTSSVESVESTTTLTTTTTQSTTTPLTTTASTTETSSETSAEPVPTTTQQASEASPEASEAIEDGDQRRPAKLEIFNLGQSNTSSVNLDNVVFVPNLQGLQVQQRLTTSGTTTTPSVETSRSVVSVEQSSDGQNERQSKAIDASKSSENKLLAKQTTKEEPETPVETPESSIDELDRLQSGLFNKHLTNLTNNLNADASDKGPRTTSTSTTTTEAAIVASRAPFRASFERPRHPFDILNAPPRATTAAATPSVESTSESTTIETSTLSLFERLLASKSVIRDEMSALLPPDFAQDKEATVSSTEATTSTTQQTTQSNGPLDKLFDSLPVKFDDVSSFLPPGFKMPEPEPESSTITTTTTTTKSGLSNLFEAAVLDDLSGLLPPGFKNQLTVASSTEPTSPVPIEETTTRKTGLVFPTRASPARNVTTEKARFKPTFSPVEIKSGWPVRATTEFTGWPSPPTPQPTPAASTSTTSRSTSARTTARTTTTTTTTPRVTTPGVCGELCRLAGTVRLVEGVEWVPELRDHNTREWYQLANSIEIELDAVYQNGPLAPWYTGIEVEAFSRGSVLVDYYLTLNGTAELDTGEIRNYFHLSLDTEGERLKLGNFTVDPKSTDFIVVPQSAILGEKERVAAGGVSEWVIAVIVVGLASLIFVIAFGATMMIRRRRQHKRKSVPLTEEMLNELNKNHMSGVDNHSADSFYDVGDAWDHRTAFPTKPIKPLPRPASVNAIRTHGTAGFANYHNYNNLGNHLAAGRPQLHDLWRSEWDGARYYDHSNSGTAQRIKAVPRPATSYGRYPTYGRPRPDYDDDF